ncbi:protein-disulfide isomerase [Bacillus thermophilus]|uniref:Protein-disulfide isomerase n=1 Tax=Siminovitchia thermophila TaxID=1245522 RepID=A0ABS2R1W4_9BACI|nr:DsbA family protein [Siminovitchia thermophila]MBM7713564.1 protein-disulfide isomerase [Siminovitchia thermophila]
MNSKKLVLFTLGFIALLVAIVFLVNQQDKDTQSNKKAEHPPIEQQPTMGKTDAPVSIVEFGDYKCPSCKAWGETVFPQLEKEFIQTGKATFSYINVLFHGEESTLAALASESVYKQDPDSFWAFHNAVFAQQPETQQHDNQWVTSEKLVEIAKETAPEIDLKQLEEDINTEGTKEEVKKDDDLVKEFNVELTPTIIINGVMVEDPFDYDAIVSLIEKELEKKNE